MRLKIRIKLLALLSLFAVLPLLFSCSAIPGYNEPEDQHIVSALGFDEGDGGLLVSVRTVSEDGKSTKVYTGVGDSVEYALAHLEGGDSKRLETGHCAVIVIGDSISGSRLSEIIEHCRRNDSITISARFASAHSARELLSCDSADGYSLLGSLREGGDGNGLGKGSRFYEIEGVRVSESKIKVYHMPYFSVSEGEYSLSGLKVFRGDHGVVLLDRRESIFYLMLRGELDEGVADVEHNGGMTSIRLSGCRTEFDFEESEGALRIHVSCRLVTEGDALTVAASEAEKGFARGAEEFGETMWERYGDIFGMGNRYSGTFEKVIITVSCKLQGGDALGR